MRTVSHWIGGKPATGTSTRTSPVWNPATGEQQAEVLLASTDDVNDAVQTAAAAYESWSESSLSQRTKVLFNFPMEKFDPGELLGASDFPSIWNQRKKRGMQAHLIAYATVNLLLIGIWWLTSHRRNRDLPATKDGDCCPP